MISKSKLIIVFLIIFVSCKKTLTLSPEDTLNPSNYFENENELQQWTNQFYTLLPGASDAGINADDNVSNVLGDLMMGQRDPTSVGGWDWSELRKINFFLQNSSNCKDTSVATI